MSVTFSPNKVIKNDPNNMEWTLDFVAHTPYQEWPDSFKKLSQEVGGDIGFWMWNLGIVDMPFILDFVKKYNLKLYENRVSTQVFVDSVPYHIAIIAHGEPIGALQKHMTLANTNAHALCQLLNIDPESGTLDPYMLADKIEKVRESGRLIEFTRPFVDEKDDAPLGLGGPRMIDMGLSVDKLNNYLLSLEELCDYCIQNQCNIHYS